MHNDVGDVTNGGGNRNIIVCGRKKNPLEEFFAQFEL